VDPPEIDGEEQHRHE
jgi:hypothetical protein